MTDLSPIAFTLDEATAVSKMSRTELYRAFRRGDLTAKKQGRRTLVLRDELERFLGSLPNFQAAA